MILLHFRFGSFASFTHFVSDPVEYLGHQRVEKTVKIVRDLRILDQDMRLQNELFDFVCQFIWEFDRVLGAP